MIRKKALVGYALIGLTFQICHTSSYNAFLQQIYPIRSLQQEAKMDRGTISWLVSITIKDYIDFGRSEINKKEKSYHDHRYNIVHGRLSYSWENKHIPPSPPPPLMGKQMGKINTIGIPPLGYTLDGNVKIFRLIAQPVERTIVDESKKTDWEDLIPKKNLLHDIHKHLPIIQKLKAWGYNGVTPGPTIEVDEGDRVRIIVKNELPEPTSIHWHGLEIPNNMDGATPETNRPILPGETFTYEFTVYQSGTFIYHSGFNVAKQDDYGLQGFFISHPKKYDHEIDRDIAIFLQQWKLLPGIENPNLTDMEFNWFTFNGLAAPNIPMITVNQGERVRLRFGNVIMMSHPIHLHGYAWKVVGTEGGPIPVSAQWPGNTISVAPGTTRDVEFVAWNPGLWRLHCHKLHHIMNAHAAVPLPIMQHGGMFTILYVKPNKLNEPWKHPKEKYIQG